MKASDTNNWSSSAGSKVLQHCQGDTCVLGVFTAERESSNNRDSCSPNNWEGLSACLGCSKLDILEDYLQQTVNSWTAVLKLSFSLDR